MTLADALETPRIHRVAGLTGARAAVGTARPCRAPHHTISDVGVIGGGQVPRPGEVSWAHHGRRFRDELPEFRRYAPEVLPQTRSHSLICTGNTTRMVIGRDGRIRSASPDRHRFARSHVR
jgi:magnesium chelatase family protein